MQESFSGIVVRIRVGTWAFQRLRRRSATGSRAGRLRPVLRGMAVATMLAAAAASMLAQDAEVAAGRGSGSPTLSAE